MPVPGALGSRTAPSISTTSSSGLKSVTASGPLPTADDVRGAVEVGDPAARVAADERCDPGVAVQPEFVRLGGRGVTNEVPVGAAVQDVAAGAADKRVVACASDQRVSAGDTTQIVGPVAGLQDVVGIRRDEIEAENHRGGDSRRYVGDPIPVCQEVQVSADKPVHRSIGAGPGGVLADINADQPQQGGRIGFAVLSKPIGVVR